jgi:protein tyrosine phosphatase (PTP) superfamily phosphohydrolase (DUF442 family)
VVSVLYIGDANALGMANVMSGAGLTITATEENKQPAAQKLRSPTRPAGSDAKHGPCMLMKVQQRDYSNANDKQNYKQAYSVTIYTTANM